MTSARFASNQWKANIWRASRMISSRVCYWQTLRIVYKHKSLKPPASVSVQSILAESPILHWNQVSKKRYFTLMTFTNHETHIQICFLKIRCLWSTGCRSYGLLYLKVADNVKESQKGCLLNFVRWKSTEIRWLSRDILEWKLMKLWIRMKKISISLASLSKKKSFYVHLWHYSLLNGTNEQKGCHTCDSARWKIRLCNGSVVELC